VRVALCAVVCVLALGAVYSHAEGQFRTVSLAEGIYAFVAPDTVEDVQGNVTLVVGRDAALLFAQGLATAADRVAPMLPAYAGGFVLTASALGLWWWAEN